MNWNEMAKEVHAANTKWWTDINTGERLKRNRCELLALVHSELSEALEGERKNLMDDKLPHRKMAEVEMADAVIRILDFCGGMEISIFEAKEGFGSPVPENKGEAIFWMHDAVGVAFFSCAYGKLLRMIEEYCEYFGYDLEGAIKEKLDFNRTRKDHSHESRRAENGKKF